VKGVLFAMVGVGALLLAFWFFFRFEEAQPPPTYLGGTPVPPKAVPTAELAP
jgi:hypothetical protein